MRRFILLCLLLLALLPAARAGALEPHEAYMDGPGEGVFAPRRSLTRAEAAALLAKLTGGGGETASVFADVPENAWYCAPVASMASRGVLRGYEDGTFRPDAAITRAELLAALVNCFQPEPGAARFADVPDGHWAGESIAAAASAGWVQGYGDGTFRPDQPVSRAEAAVILNAALGRSAEASLDRIRAEGVRPFADVRPEDWFYGAVVEATTAHEAVRTDGVEVWDSFRYRSCGVPSGLRRIGGAIYAVDENEQITALPPGFQTIEGRYYYVSPEGCIPFPGEGPVELDGQLYCLQADGSLLRDGACGVLSFDSEGRYTCGDAALDAQVRALLSECTAGAAGREDKLRSAYNYLRDHCRYLSRAHQSRGSADWLPESAGFWFQHRKGNCYCYAAVFLYLSRQLGYQSLPVSGGVGPRNADHAWVMIDGCIFDPEYECQMALQGRYYNLYRLNPSDAPFPYIFPD